MIDMGDAMIDGEGMVSEDIIRCLECLYATIEGTCPMDREFGITIDAVDKSPQIARNIYALDVVEKTEKYEPRVVVEEVTFKEMEGRLIPRIKIKPNEDYSEDGEAGW